jgi:hypothetical protein
MIRDEAEKLSARLQERLDQGTSGSSGVAAAVEVTSKRVEFAAPGGARPTVVRYKITLTGGGLVARLGLDEAEALLDEIDPDWTADRLFEEIRSRGLPVEAPD